MTPRPAFLLDENIDPVLADGLRQEGLEARSVRELNLLGATDQRIMEITIEHGYILVTRDIRDFLSLVGLYRGVGRSIPGVLLVPLSIPQSDPGALIGAVMQWIERAGGEESIPGGIAWLSPASSSEGDHQIRESRPRYQRALERIGATI